MEDVARGIGLQIQTQETSGSIGLPLAKFLPSDLKKLFSLTAKALNSVPFQQQLIFCDDWFSELSSLGIELNRSPNYLNPSDLTKVEFSQSTALAKEQIKKDKLLTGITAINHLLYDEVQIIIIFHKANKKRIPDCNDQSGLNTNVYFLRFDGGDYHKASPASY